MKGTLRTLLATDRPILHCGSTGTELMKVGGDTPGPVNNVTHPEEVRRVQRRYVEVGANILLANTFAMNPLFAAVHAKGYDWRELNEKGVAIAKEVAGTEAFVLGNVGPVGEMLAPFGELTPTAAYDAYREQAELLASLGIDGFSLQTFFHLEDMKIAVRAVRDVSDLPIVANLVFNEQGATLMGDTPQQCYDGLLPLNIDAFGHNCGEIAATTLAELFEPLFTTARLPLIALPNAGIPKTVDGLPVYDMTPSEFRAGVEILLRKGFRIVGGCCGVNADHIAAIADLF